MQAESEKILSVLLSLEYWSLKNSAKDFVSCSPSHSDACLEELLAEHSLLLGLREARRPVARPAPNAGEQELPANQPSRDCVSLAYPADAHAC